MSDEIIYDQTLDVGKRLLPAIMQLTHFVDEELLIAEKAEQASRGMETEAADSQSLKYWINLAAKTDAASNKLRCLLPANVSGHIICDLLEQKGVDKKTRDKALQLLNVKLMNETLRVEKKKDEPKVQCLEEKASLNQYLGKLTLKLNSWIGPKQVSDRLCQKAAFTLKLLAKKVPLTQESCEMFTYTLENCLKVLREWCSLDEQLVGSILLLVGELVRSQNLRSILSHIDAVCDSCFDILEKCEQDTVTEEEDEEPSNVTETDTETDEDVEITNGNSEASTALVKEDAHLPVVTRKRRRSLRLSTSGKQYGDHALLVCAMSCLQHLLDQFGNVSHWQFSTLKP
uniref:HEAT repeat-containing protein 1 n=1 Tax=Ditylenchus dipsaci TaxID=166011 RepID=A0A915DK15_9BILA